MSDSSTKTRLTQIEGRLDRLEAQDTEIKGALGAVLQRLARIDARLDQQSKHLDDQSRQMAALTPVRLAAVPASA